MTTDSGHQITPLACPTCHGFATHFMWCKHYLWPFQRKATSE